MGGRTSVVYPVQQNKKVDHVDEYDDEWWRLIDAKCISKNIICIKDTVRSTITSDIVLLANENINIVTLVEFFIKLLVCLHAMRDTIVTNDELNMLEYLCSLKEMRLISKGYVTINNCKYLVGCYKALKKSKIQYNTCPFHEFGENSKKIFDVKGWIFIDLMYIENQRHMKNKIHIENQKHIIFSEITIHQITDHNFFGGKKCNDRINPRKIALFFKI